MTPPASDADAPDPDADALAPPLAKPTSPPLASFAVVGALTSVLPIVANVARTKVVAWVIGPEGIGVTAEVGQLVSLATVGAGLATAPALVARASTAYRAGDHDGARKAVASAMGLGGALWLLGVVPAIAAAPALLPRAADYPARWFVALSAIGALGNVVVGIVQALFIGTSNLRAITITTVAAPLLSACAGAALTVAFALNGQFLSVAAAGILGVLVNAVCLRWLGGPWRASLRPAFDLAFAKVAVVLGAAGLVTGYLGQVSYTIVRETLDAVGGARLGAFYNGNYQAAYTIGATYFATMMVGVGTYFSPRFAASEAPEELTRYVREAERFVLRVAPPVVLAAIAFRGDVIHLLYSDRFDPAIAILGYQLAGDVARAVSFASSGPLLLRRHVRAFMALEIVGSALSAGLSVVLVRRFGPVGAGMAYAIAYAIYAACAAVALRAADRVPIAARNLAATLAITAAAVGLDLLTQRLAWTRWLVIPAVLAWLAYTGLLQAVIARARARLGAGR